MSSDGAALSAFLLIAGPIILFAASWAIASVLALISLRIRRDTFQFGRFMVSTLLWWIGVVVVGGIGGGLWFFSWLSHLIGSGCVNC